MSELCVYGLEPFYLSHRISVYLFFAETILYETNGVIVFFTKKTKKKRSRRKLIRGHICDRDICYHYTTTPMSQQPESNWFQRGYNPLHYHYAMSGNTIPFRTAYVEAGNRIQDCSATKNCFANYTTTTVPVRGLEPLIFRSKV